VLNLLVTSHQLSRTKYQLVAEQPRHCPAPCCYPFSWKRSFGYIELQRCND